MTAGIYWFNSPQPTPAGQTVLLVGIGGVGLLCLLFFCQAIVATLRHFRFRDLGLALNAEPVVAGSELRGTLKVPIPFTATHEFRVALIASELTAVRSKDSYNTNTRELFRQESAVRGEPEGAGTLLRFSFRLPDDAHESLGYGEPIVWSGRTADRVYVKWQLEFSADVPGIDLNETFEIPVVRPGASELPLRKGHNPSFVLERDKSDLRIRQPAWKKPGRLALVAEILGAGALSGIFATAMELRGPIGGLLFLSGIGLGLGILAYLAHELAIVVRPDGLRIVRRIGSRILMDVNLERSRIAAIEAVASFGRHADNIPARNVRIRTQDGETYTLAEFMTRTRDVRALSNLVAARLALDQGALVGTNFAQSAVHCYDAPSSPAVKWAGSLVALGFVAWLVWPWFEAVIEKNDWQEVMASIRDRNSSRAPASAEPSSASASAEASVARWEPSFERALKANSAQRFDEAEREFHKILSMIDREFGPDHPVAGMIYSQLAVTYENQRKADAREAALKRALEILERHPAKAAKEAMGSMGWHVDKESVARELGDQFWSRRRYADAFGYYQKAYAAAAELDTTDEIRNERLALSAAGVMVTSCTLGKWDISDRAMAEVKQRYPTVPANSQSRLKYWIDTGEPRLKARQC